jgi:hypothetical protein
MVLTLTHKSLGGSFLFRYYIPMEEFISFKDIYHHIALAIAIVLGATWSETIKDKLATFTPFKGIKGGFLQSIAVTLILLALLMGCYVVLFSLQRQEDAYLKKQDEDEQPDAFVR